MADLTGQQLGNYRLVKHLGRGGFGEVYLGTHVHLQREAAIKLLLKLDEREIERFRNEAQIIARLSHPHIIPLFDYDVAGEIPFIVMLYASQGNMRTRYNPGTRIPFADVVRYINQAASGLQFAHDHQVLHRDVKPANMLLGPDGKILLSDFGLAVLWSGTNSFHAQQVMGTQGYMAPEQFRGRPRAASDQYSLAVTAYQWLSGARPMADAHLGLGMLQLAHPEMEVLPVRRMVPELPPRIDEVLHRALSREWQARFPSVREFAEELTRAASSKSPTRSVHSSDPATLINSRPNTYGPSDRQPATTAPASPVASPQTIAATQPAGTAAANAQPWYTSSTPTIPPPPPEHSAYEDSVTPPPPPTGSLPRGKRPLALPIPRKRNTRATWSWTIGYTVFLLVLGAALAGMVAIYRPTSSPPAWLITLTIIDVLLLILLGTVLCGALLGKWRALLVSLLTFGLTALGCYLMLARTYPSALTTSSNENWQGLLMYLALPISTFGVGWIYERRQYAHFGKSFASISAGVALLVLLPIIISTIVNSSSSGGNSPGSLLTSYLITVWCLGPLLVIPLALFTTGLEMLLHKFARGIQSPDASV